jgi:hypothetical protein
MSAFDETQDDRAERLQRFRKLSALLGEDKRAAPLGALALEMARRLIERSALRAGHEELMRLRQVMLAELDVVIAWTRSHVLRPPGFSAEDLREESRLCREEAGAALDSAMRRSFASRAFDLAMLAERRARQADD